MKFIKNTQGDTHSTKLDCFWFSWKDADGEMEVERDGGEGVGFGKIDV